MKKILAGVALASLITLSAGAAAQAAPTEYPAGLTCTLSAATIAAGSSVVFSCTGFTGGETIDITITQTSAVAGGAIGSVGGGISASVPMVIKPAALAPVVISANDDGSFSTPITFDQVGTYTLTATGRTSGVTVSQVVKVVASVDEGAANNGSNSGNNVAADEDGLASTGLDTSVLVWSLIGVGALGAGVGTVVVSRRRNRESANA